MKRSKCLTFENFVNFEMSFASRITPMKSEINRPKLIGSEPDHESKISRNPGLYEISYYVLQKVIFVGAPMSP